MKVVVLTGPESTGKTWLAERLAHRFGGQVVGEYVREFIDQQGRDTCLADIPHIARMQLEREDQARAAAPPLLLLDTHLLSNILWSRTLFGSAPDWLESELLARHYDLHLLLSPEGVPWHDDGQRCQPDLIDRQRFHADCRDWLLANGQRVIELSGDWPAREAAAIEQLQRLLT